MADVIDHSAQAFESIPWPIIGAVTGALVAGYVNAYISRRQTRANRVLDFHKEFHGSDMSASRARAWRYVKASPTTRFDHIEDDHEDASGSRSLYVVMRFFQRLSVCVERKFIDVNVARDLFGEVFIWWDIVSFEEGLRGSGWEVERVLRGLNRAFVGKGLISRFRNRKRVKRWAARGLSDRTNYLAAWRQRQQDGADNAGGLL
jgi:hypothetical protein